MNDITLSGLSNLEADTITASTDVIIPRIDTALIPSLGSTISLATLAQNMYYDNVDRRFKIYSDDTTLLFQVDTFFNLILVKSTKLTLNGTILSLDTGSSILAGTTSISPTELSYLDNATSNIQAQINAISGGLSGYVTLTTTQTITGTKTMNDLLPIFATNTTSYKMGTNAMQYQQATSANNIAWGTNALRGKSTLPANNVSKRNICVGDNAGQNMQDSPCDDNVIMGYNACSTAYYQTQQNVILGSGACRLNVFPFRNVIIGYNAVGTGASQISDCVVIGANAGTTLSNKSNVVCIGASNGYLSNSFTVVGSFNLSSAIQGNRITILGSQNLINSNFDAFSCAIGNENGANQTTGFYNIYIGQFCNVASGGILNSATIGLSATIPRSHCLYLGASTADSITYQNMCIAFKNTIRCAKTITGTSYTIAFEDEENLYITDDLLTALQLPTPATGSGTIKNVGACWTILRAQSTPATITISAPAGQTLRLPAGGTASSYTMTTTEWYVQVACVANSGTSYQITSSQTTTINNIARCSENLTNSTVSFGNGYTPNDGLYNTLIGRDAGKIMSGTSVQLNTAIGWNALGSLTTMGQLNTAVGAGAGQNLGGGIGTLSRNTFIGTNSGPLGPSADISKTCYFGGNSGAITTTGEIDECTLLGHSTDFAVATGSYRNSTAIGAHSTIYNDNEIVLGGLNQNDGVSYPQVVMPAKLRLQSAQLYNSATYNMVFGRSQAETIIFQTNIVDTVNLPSTAPTNVGYTCTITRAYIPIITDTITIYSASTENIQSADVAPSTAFMMDWSITSLRLTLVDTAGTINWVASYSRQFNAISDATNVAYPVAFSPLSDGAINGIYTDPSMTYNPSSNTLTTTNLSSTSVTTTRSIYRRQAPVIQVTTTANITYSIPTPYYDTYQFCNMSAFIVTYNLPTVTSAITGWTFRVKRLYGSNLNVCTFNPSATTTQPIVFDGVGAPSTAAYNMSATQSMFEFQAIQTQLAGITGTFTNVAGATQITINSVSGNILFLGGIITLAGNVNATRVITSYITGRGGTGTYGINTAITLANTAQNYTSVASFGYILTAFN